MIISILISQNMSNKLLHEKHNFSKEFTHVYLHNYYFCIRETNDDPVNSQETQEFNYKKNEY